MTLPVPPQPSGGDSGLGVYGWWVSYSLQDATQVPNGPNAGFAYYASPLSFPTFYARYTINPDLENSGSTFSQKQYGACGFISWSNLLTQTHRHEYDHATQSHHGKYVSGMESHNLGDYVEPQVATPGANLTTFNNETRGELNDRLNQITSLVEVEPYPVNYSAAGQPLGNINYAPYANCP